MKTSTEFNTFYYFETIPEGTVNVANRSNGSALDQFIEHRRTGAKSLMTIPLIGWTTKASSPRAIRMNAALKSQHRA